ncbi:hypothetical protein JYQ62_16130 [Nostoc sp. UHCC 0702]|nr:hypothetical protein JYQ62_16130 [Nostoc sp. UHCC 0702]
MNRNKTKQGSTIILSQPNSFFAPILEEGFDLYIINIFNDDGSSQKIKYLCSNDRWAMAVLHYLHGKSDSYSIDHVDYYPLIKLEHPEAIVIPPMPVELEDFFLAIGFQSRLAISNGSNN